MCIFVARYCDASTIQTHHLLSNDGWEMLGLPEPSCSLFDLVLIAEHAVTHIVVRRVATALDLSDLFTCLLDFTMVENRDMQSKS